MVFFLAPLLGTLAGSAVAGGIGAGTWGTMALAGLGSGLASYAADPDDPRGALMNGLLAGATAGIGGLAGAGKEAATAGVAQTATAEAAKQAATQTAAKAGTQAAAKTATTQALSEAAQKAAIQQAARQAATQAATQGATGAATEAASSGMLQQALNFTTENPLLAAAMLSGMMSPQGGPEEEYDPSKYPEQFPTGPGPQAGYAGGLPSVPMPTDPSAYLTYGQAGSPMQNEQQFFRRGYRAGGLVVGPGTGTSDSVPAVLAGYDSQPIRLSAGEYVMPAKAVRNYGGSGEMDKLRNRLMRG